MATVRQQKSVKIFYSYAHEDEDLRDELEKHLILLRRQGVITQWHDRQITAGQEWRGQIDEHLHTADLILLLISADFVASDYCYDVELMRALERHKRGSAIVIPIILRPVDNWQSAPFGGLQALPQDGKPVTTWEHQDEAFADIVQGIRRTILNEDEGPSPEDKENRESNNSEPHSASEKTVPKATREKTFVHTIATLIVTILMAVVFVVFPFFFFQRLVHWPEQRNNSLESRHRHDLQISPKIVEAIYIMQSLCLARSELTIETEEGGNFLALKKGKALEGRYREIEIPSLLTKLQSEIALMKEAREIRACTSSHTEKILSYILQDQS